MSRSVRAGAVCLLLIVAWNLLWASPQQRKTISTTVANTWKSPVLTSDVLGSDDGNGSRDVSQTPLLEKTRLSSGEASMEDNLADVKNATLGFQKVFILSMPSRSDKRDAIALSAFLTGIKFEFFDGVKGEEIDEKAYPDNWPKDERPGTLGCWRGHMEIYQKMLREGIQTALIMEDDIDWDVTIKEQLTEFARGARYLQEKAFPNRPAKATAMHSPYGEDWDLMTTGHCGILNSRTSDHSYWVTENDPTVITPEERQAQRSLQWNWRVDPSLSAIAGNHSRVVTTISYLKCTQSYAISLKGAAGVLHDQAVLPNAKAIDDGLGGFCKRTENFCLASWPTLTGSHLPAGDVSKQSDRRPMKMGKVREVARSLDLAFPTRLNLGTLLNGETVAKAQFPENAMLSEIDISSFELPRGGPVEVKASDQVKKVESAPEQKKTALAPSESSTP